MLWEYYYERETANGNVFIENDISCIFELIVLLIKTPWLCTDNYFAPDLFQLVDCHSDNVYIPIIKYMVVLQIDDTCTLRAI